MKTRAAVLALTATLAAATIPAAADDAAEARFLTDAILIHMGEISLGQLAEDEGLRTDVRALGLEIVVDHERAINLAIEVAETIGVATPEEIPPGAEAVYAALTELEGGAFDRAFVSHMIADHRAMLETHREYAQGEGPVAEYARETVPALESHLESARRILVGMLQAEPAP